jgi:Flp pilus assembly protein TadG
MTWLWRLRRCDDGALTPMVVVFIAAIFLMVGLAVDGGGRMRAAGRADDIAAEAARAGGQALNLPQAISGRADIIDPHAATAAANAYLADAHVTGHAVVSGNGKTITVTVTIPYNPAFLGVLGIGPWVETGTATAQLLTG